MRSILLVVFAVLLFLSFTSEVTTVSASSAAAANKQLEITKQLNKGEGTFNTPLTQDELKNVRHVTWDASLRKSTEGEFQTIAHQETSDYQAFTIKFTESGDYRIRLIVDYWDLSAPGFGEVVMRDIPGAGAEGGFHNGNLLNDAIACVGLNLDSCVKFISTTGPLALIILFLLFSLTK